MKLYNYFRSSASFRVRIALNFKGLPYEYAVVHLTKGGGQQFAPEFRAINPDALIPVLDDDGPAADAVAGDHRVPGRDAPGAAAAADERRSSARTCAPSRSASPARSTR